MLIDVHAIMFRIHFSSYGGVLQNAAGEQTSISYGVMKTLLDMLEVRPPPTHLAMVMDAPGKTFRSATPKTLVSKAISTGHSAHFAALNLMPSVSKLQLDGAASQAALLCTHPAHTEVVSALPVAHPTCNAHLSDPAPSSNAI